MNGSYEIRYYEVRAMGEGARRPVEWAWTVRNAETRKLIASGECGTLNEAERQATNYRSALSFGLIAA